MLIAGDVGGTKANLALFAKEGELLYSNIFPTQKYSTFQEIVLKFSQESLPFTSGERIQSATFAIAGPVQGGVCRTTNLPWVVEERVLEKLLSFPVTLINDLEANAYAIEVLPKESFYLLHQGKEKSKGNRAVISPGTGLGEAALYFDGEHYHPFACEGGHTEFGPRDEQELELCRYLIDRFGHASYERILSGPGLHNIYLFLLDQRRVKEPDWLQKRMKEEDPSRVISEEGMKESFSLCQEALHIFVSILGAEAGNCVLKFMAVGGIYIGGGIAPKILQMLKKSFFVENFTAKGRFHDLMAQVPIYLILDDKASLLGAAHYGCTHISRQVEI